MLLIAASPTAIVTSWFFSLDEFCPISYTWKSRVDLLMVWTCFLVVISGVTVVCVNAHFWLSRIKVGWGWIHKFCPLRGYGLVLIFRSCTQTFPAGTVEIPFITNGFTDFASVSLGQVVASFRDSCPLKYFQVDCWWAGRRHGQSVVEFRKLLQHEYPCLKYDNHLQ